MIQFKFLWIIFLTYHDYCLSEAIIIIKSGPIALIAKRDPEFKAHYKINVIIVYLYFDMYKPFIPTTSISIGNSEVVC